MCVKYVCRAPISPAVVMASASVKCVGCGRCRSASSTSTSRSSSSGQRRRGHVVAVGQVREASEPEARESASGRAESERARSPCSPRRNGPSIGLEIELRHAAAGRRASVERVVERPPDPVERARVRVQRHRAAGHVIESPDLVEPHDVIGMRVRDEERVHPANVVRERLRSQVGRRVHEHARVVVELDVRGRAEACVARIGRSADVAVAADHGHAVRRAGAEEQNTHELRMLAWPAGCLAGAPARDDHDATSRAEPTRAGAAFARLVEVMATLRSPHGCPGIGGRRIASLRPYLLEETYEALDAIERARLRRRSAASWATCSFRSSFTRRWPRQPDASMPPTSSAR